MKRSKATLTVIASLACLLAVRPLPAQAAAEGTFHQALKVTGPVTLDIATGSGNVNVRTGDNDTVDVTGHIRVTEWLGNGQEKVQRLEKNPPIQQSGNTIHIGHIQDSDLRRNVSISYDVIVPAQTDLKSHSGSGDQQVEGVHGPVEVDSGSGGLKLRSIGDTVHAQTGSGSIEIDHVKGNVRAHTGSGSIRATDIGGGFEANSGSGHIVLEQVAPGAVHVETGSGGIELRGIRGSLDARAGSGGIRAEGEPTGGWMVHSGSGSIHLRLPSDAAFDLNAHTSSGSIQLEHPVTVQGTLGQKEIRGKVRGGGVPLEVETGSGNIEIL
jgi:DUF4097 and DUF4098 domain-containing protein YvlB